MSLKSSLHTPQVVPPPHWKVTPSLLRGQPQLTPVPLPGRGPSREEVGAGRGWALGQTACMGVRVKAAATLPALQLLLFALNLGGDL